MSIATKCTCGSSLNGICNFSNDCPQLVTNIEKKYPIGEDKPLSPEMDLIYRIIEQWGNAIEMPNMEGWVKEYAAKQAIPQGAVLSDLIQAQDEYTKLLGDEISDLIGIASVHGWRSTRHEKGKELREGIAMLKMTQPLGLPLKELTPEQLAVMNKTSDRLFVKDDPQAGPLWVKIAKPKLPGDYYCKCKVDGNGKRLIVEFDKNGQWGEAAGYDCYEDFEIIEWLDESGQSEQPIKNT